ncbi:hypothetical protein MNBD_ALPHA06-2044 [hydrothermal vent metagenome]|uniref:VOC domain-containing protein n=1 Tax=hydrothermal vent metagenome TaxID=652676 RepID=A0A3B0RJ94_9ZZZZ
MQLNQITMPASDIEMSLAWYLVLGFKLIVSSPDYKRLQAPAGEATLSLSCDDAPVTGPTPKIYLECASVTELDEQVTALQAKGVQFQSLPTDQNWLWREAWTADPSGNPVCLYFSGGNRLHPPWQVKNNH